MQIPIQKLRFATFSGSAQEATAQANAFLDAHDLLREPLNDVAKNMSVVNGELILTIVLQIVTPAEVPKPIAVARPSNGRGV